MEDLHLLVQVLHGARRALGERKKALFNLYSFKKDYVHGDTEHIEAAAIFRQIFMKTLLSDFILVLVED